MTKFKAWPFLVSRNRTTDYKVIVVPAFIVKAGIHSDLLSHLITGEPTEKAIYKEYTIPNLGNISIFYRVIYAKEMGNVFKDDVGRHILWIEGFVLREKAKNYEMPEQVLDISHAHIERAFQDFWKNDTKTVTQSRDIDINLNQRGDINAKKVVTQSRITHVKQNRNANIKKLIKIAMVGLGTTIIGTTIWLLFQPSLQIIFPNGGENLRIGNIYKIEWETKGIDNIDSIDISYTIDAGHTWIPIVVNESNNGTYEWKVRNIPPSKKCLVKIVAKDSGGGKLAEAQSKNNFTIGV